MRHLGTPEIYIYCRDNDASCQAKVEDVNQRTNGVWATLANKGEIENYPHRDPRRMVLGFEIEIDDGPSATALGSHQSSRGCGLNRVI